MCWILLRRNYFRLVIIVHSVWYHIRIAKDAPRTLAPRIDAGVGASLSEGEGADVDGDVGVGEGET
jgi:hypothetical protein